MADLVLRQVSYAGQGGDEINIAGVPLTNTQIDQNFINLNEFVHTKASLSSPIFTGAVTIPSGTIEDTAIGQTTPRAGAFTTLGSSAINFTGGSASGITINNSSIGATTANSGRFTTLTATDNVTFNMSQKKVEMKPTGTGGTVEIAPGTLGSINNMSIGGTTAAAGTFTNITLGSSDSNTITANSLFVSGTKLKTAKGNTNTLSLSAYDVDGTAYTDLITLTASNTPTLAIVSTGVGSINNMAIGGSTAAAGTFTSLTASSLTSSGTNGVVTLSPTGTGTVTINPATAGSINNMAIGGSTAAAGTFTSLTASSLTASSLNGVVTLSPTGTGTVTINPNTAGSINNMTIGGSTAAAGTFTSLTASGTNGVVTLSPTGTGTVTISPAGAVTINPTTAGSINNMSIGGTTAAAGTFTSLTASSLTASSSNGVVTLSPTGTGTVTISPAGAVTINPTTAGSINNMDIGGSTAAAGTFTNLTATGTVSLTNALSILNGGTGTNNAPTQGGVIYASSSTSYASTGAGTEGYVLTSNGAGAPTWEDLALTITDETTDATRYITFAQQTDQTTNSLNTSSEKFTVNPSTGDMNAVNFNSLSDARKKENIVQIIDALDIVLRLRGVKFNWKETGSPSVGVIAQEVEPIVSEVVSTSTSGEKSVNYAGLIGILIEAIKEQNVRIEKLESLIK